MRATVVALLAVCAFVNGHSLPPSFKTCQRSLPNYSQCLDEDVTIAIKSLAKGLRPFGILPIEPLAVNSVKIGDNSGPVTLKQEYHNIELHGLTKGLEVRNYDIDWDKLILRSDSFNPQVDFVADYSLNGNVLVLPITGNGRSNITMLNLHAKNTIYCETYEKDGETYLRIKKYDIKFSPEKVLLSFDNLFDGDRVLGDQMNIFLNENSDLLFKELQGPYEETFSQVFKKIGNDIFSRIAMKILFPE